MKKISVIGRGTVGCLTILKLLHDYGSKCEIEWIYDPDIEPSSVGEGTTLVVSKYLGFYGKITYETMHEFNSIPKLGIYKQDWGKKNKQFIHDFPAGSVGIHFNAVEFQKYVFNILASQQITHTHTNVNPDDLDSDYVITCTGMPKLNNEYEELQYVPVNAAFVTQCPWDMPKFQRTLTIARPYGWVFGIPLDNRVSIGYLYNDKINSEEDIKKDVQNIFDQFSLNPGQTRSLKFNNYKRKRNFYDRKMYSGTASFFVEPLEATNIGAGLNGLEMGLRALHGKNNWNNEIANNAFDSLVNEIEGIIALHYMSGSSFKSEFWDYAQDLGHKFWDKQVKEKTKFYELVNDIEKDRNIHRTRWHNPLFKYDTDMWTYFSYRDQMSKLGLNLNK